MSNISSAGYEYDRQVISGTAKRTDNGLLLEPYLELQLNRLKADGWEIETETAPSRVVTLGSQPEAHVFFSLYRRRGT